MALLEQQGFVCAVTGVPIDFAADRPEAGKRKPWAPSLDRITPSLGYVPGNVRVTTVAANYAMNEWGEDIFRHMMQAREQRAQDVVRAANARLEAVQAEVEAIRKCLNSIS